LASSQHKIGGKSADYKHDVAMIAWKPTTIRNLCNVSLRMLLHAHVLRAIVALLTAAAWASTSTTLDLAQLLHALLSHSLNNVYCAWRPPHIVQHCRSGRQYMVLCNLSCWLSHTLP